MTSGSLSLCKPRCALKIAVVGNRRFGGETNGEPQAVAERMKGHAASACTAVWQALMRSQRTAFEGPLTVGDDGAPASERSRIGEPRLKDLFDAQPPLLTVLSSLAAGADQIGARTALDAGQGATSDVEVTLEAVLPFSEDDYPGRSGELRPEFTTEDAKELEALTAQARQVVRMDGRYGDQGGQHVAYRQCQDLLFQHADIVLAIYDPEAAAGKAGTLDAVRQAQAAGRFVVAVLVSETDARIAMRPSSTDPLVVTRGEEDGSLAVADDGWRRELAQHVQELLTLPHQETLDNEVTADDPHRLKSLEVVVERLRLIYGEEEPHRLCASPVLSGVFGRIWAATLRLCQFFSGKRKSRPPESLAGGQDDTAIPPYAAFSDRAEELAGAYMRTYRGAFVLSFLLAAVAVTVAVLMLAVLLLPERPPWEFFLALGVVKIGVLVLSQAHS